MVRQASRWRHKMSIHWEAFNKDLDVSPAALVHEIRRITVVPEHCSVAQFLDVYAKEAQETDQPWKAAMMDYCIAVWLFRAYKYKPDGTQEGEQELSTNVTNKWMQFTELVDALPDIWDEDCDEP